MTTGLKNPAARLASDRVDPIPDDIMRDLVQGPAFVPFQLSDEMCKPVTLFPLAALSRIHSRARPKRPQMPTFTGIPNGLATQ